MINEVYGWFIEAEDSEALAKIIDVSTLSKKFNKEGIRGREWILKTEIIQNVLFKNEILSIKN